MLPRILEPEVMDSVSEAVDYDSMDHSEVNRRFVDQLLEHRLPAEGSNDRPIRVLDVGTGTALIPLELCRRDVPTQITAIDLAAYMLQVGQRNVIREGLQSRIKLEHLDAKDLPYSSGSFDWVISNSIVHHIPDPLPCLREMIRVLAPEGLLFVRDLLRPPDLATLKHFVQTYAAEANAHQQQMFDDSLHAALTLEEVRTMLGALNLPLEWVTQTTDRHWTICARITK
ncbi:MAG: rebM 1 [Planctomycetaceae bacterium]|nr:rebM 1 [Planctomycetaceae bacterium]